MDCIEITVKVLMSTEVPNFEIPLLLNLDYDNKKEHVFVNLEYYCASIEFHFYAGKYFSCFSIESII